MDDLGETYYHNASTQETSWQRPLPVCNGNVRIRGRGRNRVRVVAVAVAEAVAVAVAVAAAVAVAVAVAVAAAAAVAVAVAVVDDLGETYYHIASTNPKPYLTLTLFNPNLI